MSMRKTLNERQKAVLERVAAGDELSAPEDVSIRATVYALSNRGLLTWSKHSDVFRASITPRGKNHLAGGEPGERTAPAASTGRRRPPRATEMVASERRRQASALVGRLVADRKVTIESPSDETVAFWRKVVDFAKRHDLPPAGFRIEKERTSRGDLTIRLIEGAHFNSRASQLRKSSEPVVQAAEPEIPQALEMLHPAVLELREKPKALNVCTDCQPRALRILDKLARLAESLGHTVKRCSEDAVIALVVHESTYEVALEESHEEAPADERPKYAWQRITSYEQVPTGKLDLVLLPRVGYSLGRHRWGDRKRWTLEDQLPQVLAEIVRRGEAALQTRVEKERAQEDKRRRWEAAMARARRDFVTARRVEILRDQVKRWQDASRIDAYCDEMQKMLPELDDPVESDSAAEWVAWAREYAQRTNPLLRKLKMPDVTDPDEEDLKPFLKGWSPYGPDESRSY